jgi:hypothetical protein
MDAKSKAIEKKMHSVSEYNREGEKRYKEAVSKHKPFEAFPHPGMYMYSREKTGQFYKRGRVVSYKHPEGSSGSRYFHKKKAAQEYYDSLK